MSCFAENVSGSHQSGLLLTGESYQVSLDTAGTYSYGDGTSSVNMATIIVSGEPKSTEPEGEALFLPVVQRQ